MLTGRMVRGARAMLGWSVETLAHRAHVGIATVSRVERCNEELSGQYRTINKIERALHEGGVNFIEGSAGRGGVEFGPVNNGKH